MTSTGLSASEASRLLEKYGPNSVEIEASRSRLALVLSVLREPMLLLLLLLNVPFIRDAFELTSLSVKDYSQLILFVYLSVSWLDLLKIITRYRTSH